MLTKVIPGKNVLESRTLGGPEHLDHFMSPSLCSCEQTDLASRVAEHRSEQSDKVGKRRDPEEKRLVSHQALLVRRRRVNAHG